MAKIVKTLTVSWQWSGDKYSLRGFNLAVTPAAKNPKEEVVATAFVETKEIKQTYSYKMGNVTLDKDAQYKIWVQAVYENSDSDWVATGGATVSDDGSATIITKTDREIQDVVNMASDNILTRQEKISLRREWQEIVYEFLEIESTAISQGIPSSNTAFSNFKSKGNALGTYLNGGTTWTISSNNKTSFPLWINDSNLGSNTSINGNTYRETFRVYYEAKVKILEEINKYKVNSVQVGGVNLLVGTATAKNTNVNVPTSFATFDPYTTHNKQTLEQLGFKVGDKITVGFDWSISKNGTNDYVYGNFRVEFKGIKSDGTDNQYLGVIKNPAGTFSSSNTKGRVEVTVVLDSTTIKAHSLRFRIDNSVLNFKVSNLKMERGTKATGWSPALEEMENAYTVILTNEAQVIPTNSNRVPTSNTTYFTDIQVYKGTAQRNDYTIGTVNSANGITVSKTSSRVNFAVSTNTALAADGGNFVIPITIDGKTFNKTFSWSCSKQGNTGATGASGVGISKITEYYAVSSSNTTEPTSWSTTVPAMTATNKYLWNYETITYSNNTTANTSKRVIGVYGDKGNTGATGATGATGNGISKIVNYYLATSSSSGVTTSTSGWTTSVQAVSASKKYLWNYEVVTYTNGSTSTTTPCIIGTYGDKGDTGQSAKYVIVNGEQVFKYTNNFSGTPTPATITLTATKFNTSESGKWQYKDSSGTWIDWLSGGSVVTATTVQVHPTSGILGNAKQMSVRYIVGSVYDEITIVKVSDGSQGPQGIQGTQGITGQNADSVGVISKNYDVVAGNGHSELYIRGKKVANSSVTGHTVFKINKTTLAVEQTTKYTTYGNESACTEMANYLNGLSNCIVAIISSDACRVTDALRTAISKIGGSKTGTWGGSRYSHYVIGMPGLASGQGYEEYKTGASATLSCTVPVSLGVGILTNGAQGIQGNKGDKGDTGATGPQGSAGKDAYTVILTNESHTFPAENNGSIASDITVTTDVLSYKGASSITPTIGTLPTVNGLTLSKTNNRVTIVAKSGTALADSGSFNIPITVDGKSFTKTFSWAKSRKGNTGATGSAGQNASHVVVTGEQVFKYTNNFSGTPTPANITLTATKINTTATGKWQWFNGSTWEDWSTNTNTLNATTLSVSPTSGSLNTGKSIRIRYIVGSVYDEITLVKVSDGAKGTNGTNGADAYTVILTNETHTFPTQNNGNIPTALSTTTQVMAYKGATSVSPTIGTLPTVAGLTLSKSNSTVTIQANTGTSLADSGSFNIPVTVDGKTFNKTFSWSKAKQGNTGATGNAGQDAITIVLSNENHTFPCESNGNIPTALSTTCVVTAYKGGTSVTPTIGSITNPTGMTISKNGATLTIQANTGTSLADSGTVNIPITVDGKTFNKTFTWSKAKKGATGATGATGAGAKTVDIIASSQVFKSTDGGLTFSPTTITMTPKLQNVSYSNWQYSTNGGSNWNGFSNSISGWSVSGGVLTINKDCSLFTKAVTSVVFRLNTNDSSVYDTITIVKLYDVTEINIGGRNYIKDYQFKRNDVWKRNRPAESFIDTAKGYGYLTASTANPWLYQIMPFDVFKQGQKVTIQYEIKCEGVSKNTGSDSMMIRTQLTGYENDSGGFIKDVCILGQHENETGSLTNWTKKTITGTIGDIGAAKSIWFRLYARNFKGKIYFRNVKLELGNKATDLSPAPEDMDFVAQDAVNAQTQTSIFNKLTNNGATQGIYLDNGKIYINGEYIKANSITADRLSISDFTNYAQLNNDTAAKYGFTKQADEVGGAWLKRNSMARDIFISGYYTCNGGESFRIKYDISTTIKGNSSNGGTDSVYRGTAIGLYCYDGSGKSVGIVYSTRYTNQTVSGSSSTVKIPTTARKFRVFIQTESYGNWSGELKVRNIQVIKMAGGELIVDGAITADRITSGTFKGVNFEAGGSGTAGSILSKDGNNNITFQANKNGVYATKISFPNSISGSGAIIQTGNVYADGTGFNVFSTENGTLYRTEYSTNVGLSGISVSEQTYNTEGGGNVAGPVHTTRIYGSVIHIDGTMLSNGGNNRLRVQTQYGNITIGPNNNDWCHFDTDRGKFWFSKNVHVNGEIYAGSGYNQCVFHNGNCTTSADNICRTWRYPNGMQISIVKVYGTWNVNTAWGSVYSSPWISGQSFNIAFSEAPKVTINAYNDNGTAMMVCQCSAPTTTATGACYLWKPTSQTGIKTWIEYIAIGEMEVI